MKNDHRIEEMIGTVMRVAGGDTSVQVGLSGERDKLDALAMGINMMIDEIGFRNRELEGTIRELNHELGQRRRAEEALVESKEKFRTITENSADAIFITDRKGNYVYTNQTASDMLGYTRKELYDMNITDISKKEDLEKNKEAFRELLSCGELFVELELVRKDGSLIPTDLNAVLLPNGLVYGSCRDITDRKRAEKALRESEDRYRNFFKTSKDCAFITTEDGYWLDMSDDACEFFGFESNEELKRIKIPELYADPRARKEHLKKIKERGFVRDYPVDLRKKDGRVINSRITSVMVKAGDQVRYQGTIRDVTDIKEAKERIDQLNSLLLSIRNVNQIIVQGEGMEDVMAGACEALLENRDFLGLSIALLGEDGNITPRRGNGDHGLAGDWSLTPDGEGKAPDCVRKAVASKDIQVVDTRDCGACDYGKNENNRKCVLVPMLSHDRVAGLLQVGMQSDREIDREGKGLLIEVANDLAFAGEKIKAEEERETLVHELEERVKELRCLYDVSESIKEKEGLEEIFRKVVRLIPPGWHYPEITRARVVFDGREYKSEPFEESEWKLCSDIVVNGETRGKIEVYYVEERPELDEGPFLGEERSLIGGIARSLSEAIERKEAGEALEYRAEFETILTELSAGLMRTTLNQMDEKIELALNLVGKLAGVDRSYVFLLSEDGSKMNNTHEWCAEFIEPQIEKLQELSTDIFPWWMEKLRRFEYIHVPRLDDMPRAAEAEKNILREQDIQSLVVVPMVLGDSLLGFMGFDSVGKEKTWSDKDIVLLTTMGEIIISALERKRVEHALKESEERYRQLVEETNDIPFVLDKKGKIKYIGPQVERYGVVSENMEGREFSYFIHPEDIDHVRGSLEKSLRTGEEFTTEFRVGTPRLGTRWFEDKSRLIKDEKGDIINVTGILRDVTRRKAVEEELRKHRGHLEELVKERTSELRRAKDSLEASNKRLVETNAHLENMTREAEKMAKKAEKANKAKSEFLANTSHEIRTPLTAIIGFTDILLDGKLGEEQREQLIMINNSATSLLNMLNDVLDLSKIEANQMSLSSESFDLARLLEEVISVCGSRAGEKDIELFLEMDPGVPPNLEGDPVKLKQVLVNLTDNAVKFTEQGEIGVKVELRGTDGNNARLVFRVSDTGIGIPEDKLETIFRAFKQGDGSITREYGGTGLGLAISKSLVELMGGDIRAKSQPGEGSEFYFTACFKVRDPVSPRGDVGEKPVPARPYDIPKDARVLLVEDNRINRKLLDTLLKKSGVQVDKAGNGLEALEALSKGTYDMVLMDIQMPEMDGIEAVRRIREREGKGEHLPVVALTAHAMKGDRLHFLEKGMDDYISKPVDREKLYRVVARYSKGRRSQCRDTDSKHGKGLLDVESLRQRYREGDDFVCDLFSMFVEEGNEKLRKIKKGLRQGNPIMVEESAHDLKSISAGLTATAVANIARDVEKFGKERELSKAGEHIEELEKTLGETISMMNEFIKGRGCDND